MTSLVIPLATGSTASRWGEELRYCLRSAEKHLKGYGEVFIVGEAPVWLKNVTVIPATDHDKAYYKERNIFQKVILACQDNRVTDDFLFMNDDHFLLRDFAAGEFPYYYDGTIGDQTNRTDPYAQSAANTEDLIEDFGFPYFDVHCPILYNKRQFSRWMGTVDWNKKYGYCIKTLYCAFNSIDVLEDHRKIADLKISGSKTSTEIKDLIKERLFFSTNDNSRDGGMLAMFQELYPNKSQFER